MYLLQEAIVAAPFMLIALIVGLISVFLTFFLGAKVRKLKASIKDLEKDDDERQVKEKRTQYVFFLSIILFLIIGLTIMIVKFSNITFD